MPTVLVNRRRSEQRQRFTLAHELGHVIIPWHIGSIIDEVDDLDSTDVNYSLEFEANNFASEILMPREWVEQEMHKVDNPLDAFLNISDIADVSLQAAAIKFVSCLPPHHVMADATDRGVTWSARSAGTIVGVVSRGTNLSEVNPYPFPCKKWTASRSGRMFHLWRFQNLYNINFDNDTKPWRTLLNDILKDIMTDDQDRHRFAASINGVTSNANGQVRANRDQPSIVTAIAQRLHTSATQDLKFNKFVSHKLFWEFCHARARAYMEPPSRPTKQKPSANSSAMRTRHN